VGGNEDRDNISPCFGAYIAPFHVNVLVHVNVNVPERAPPPELEQ
jgi:hypothetical protein